MRVAVFSDVHGNLHALEAVLAAIGDDAPDAVWCLGDVVGYGPRPNECCAIAAERADICLVGNHDLVCIGEMDVALFNHDAAAAAEWTRGALTDEAQGFLRDLAPEAKAADAELFHASPADPVWDYVLSDYAAYAAFGATDASLILVGHSHVALQIHLDGDNLSGGLAPDGSERELSKGRWILNPGSVGQPRDGDPRAAWLLLDFERMNGSYRRVDYPIERTQDEMREAGLPELLVARLAVGE